MKAPFALLIDNCIIHKTKAVREYAKNHNIELIFIVPYSPWYNGIEEVWAMAKRI